MIKLLKYFVAQLFLCFFVSLFFGFLVYNVQAAATLSVGDLIRGSSPAVYLIKSDNKRYLFPNEKTFKTWYADFSAVKTITDLELREIPFGGNMTYKPDVRLLKLPSQPEVYKVEEGGVMRHLTTPEVASSYYGKNWPALVDDLPEIFFADYKIGEPIEAVAETPAEVPKEPAEEPAEEPPAEESAPPTLTKEKGTLVIKTAAVTPHSAIVIAGSTDVPFSTFEFSAYDEAIKIESLILKINNTIYIDNIKEIRAVYEISGGTETKIGYFNIDQVIFSNLNLTIPAGKSRLVEIRTDLNPIEDGGILPGLGADSGDTPRFEFVSATGRGEISNKTIGPDDFKSGFYQNKTSLPYMMVVRKTEPVFKLNPDTPSGSQGRPPFAKVLKFDITANPAGDVKIKELKFKIETSDIDREGAGLANDYLEKLANVNGDFADDNDIVNLYAITNPNYYYGENLADTIQFSIYDWSAKFEDTTPVGFETDERDYGLIKFKMAAGNEILIPAGQTMTLVLELYTSPLHWEPQTLQVSLLEEKPNANLSDCYIKWYDGKQEATGELLREMPVVGRMLYF